LKAGIAQRDLKRQQAEQFLNRPENRSTRDQSQFLNELIERKSFSWTRVLEDLEKVMPARVHLVSIHPELDEDNQLKLKMSIAGDSRDRAIELARRMEDSRRFAQTYIENETFSPSTNGDPFRFNIVATYVPEIEPVPAAKTETPKRSGL
jgi:type IV pilus assembly protein PilN